jgi:L-iditol 2-dehydrogenase
MKVARFYAPGDVRLEDVPEPVAGPKEVKIRVRNCSTCGTDLKIFRNGHPNMTPPAVMGHEIAGEVVEVGSEVVGGWKAGDRVQVIAAVPCGECRQCKRNRMSICENQTSVGYQYPGGFAEYLIVPHEVLKVDGLNRIPDGVGFDEASVAEPLACVINGQRLAGVGTGDVVVVVGAGPIGCLHVRLAKAHGASRVILADLSLERLKLSADRVAPDDVVDASSQDLVDEVLRLTDG